MLIIEVIVLTLTFIYLLCQDKNLRALKTASELSDNIDFYWVTQVLQA